jgi:L-lysine 2,3-aminomutase
MKSTNDTPQFTNLMIRLCQNVFPTPFFVLKKVEEAKHIIVDIADDEEMARLFDIESDIKSADYYINYYKKIVEN